MFERKIHRIAVCMLSLICYTLCLSSMTLAQNETSDKKIIERYKLMLERKPKEGSTFDRLYEFYLEGAGLEQMVTDYQAEAAAQPDNPNLQLILGHIHKRIGADTETLSAYQRAVELAPDDYYPHAALGGTYAVLRRPEEAIAALTQAAELATQSQTATLDDLTALYKALGRAYFSQNRVDNAISAWAKIAELDPQNIFARIELAELFREQELYAQAIAQHRAIVEIKKDDPYRVCMSHREIGKIQAEKGDYQDALASYDTALALTAPDNWLRKDLQHRIIAIYADDGNWEGLITHYQEKLAQTPNDVALIGLLASAYIENQQLDEGIAGYRKGLTLAPTDTDLRLNLIKVLRNAERFDEAAAEYETLSEVQPDNFHIYRELGELYLQLEDENRARRAYQRMIDRDPENAGTRLSLAEIYAEHEWFDDAIAEYEKAISLASDNPDYMEYFGEFYLRQGNREQAVETWNCMVEGDLGTAPNYDRLAQLLNAKDFRTEAITASRKAVALDPEEFRYREALARLLMENKEYDEALTQYTEAAKLAPNAFFAKQMGDQQLEIYRQQGTLAEKLEALETAPETFDQQKQLTKMYLKLGNISYALKALTKAKALQPNDVRVNRWLAELYIRQGRRDDANTIYTHLVEIDPKNAREYYAKITRYHLNAMDFDAATYAAKRVVAHSPRNPEGHQLLAEIAEQAGDYETATNNLKQAIRLRPEATDIRAELAAMYKLVGDFRQAIKQYWRCWELSDDVEDKLGFVKSLFEAYNNLGWGGEFEEKLKHKSKAKPSDMAPILALARVYRLKGDLPSARAQLAQALDRERDNPELLGQLVQINLDLGTPQDALNYQQRLVKIQPHPIHQQRLGELLFKVGREQEAIQKWTKLLYAKNQPLVAGVKLATLLIQHGRPEEGLAILDKAGEKAKDAKAIYQVGAMLVEINEYDRARPYFERILHKPKPPQTGTQKGKATGRHPTYRWHRTYGPPGIDTYKFELAQYLASEIWRSPYGHRSRRPGGQLWSPNSFEEAQAGALVQLTAIARQQGELTQLIGQLEAEADANPKDLQRLERLVQIHILTGNTHQLKDIILQLIAASPDDPAYQNLLLSREMPQNLDYETFKKYLDKMTALTPETRLWYSAQYASTSYYQGRKADAIKVLDELDTANVTDQDTGARLVHLLIRGDKLEAAGKILAQFLKRAPQLWYSNIYQVLATAYVHAGETDKAIEFVWTFLERTKPHTTNPQHVVKLGYTQYAPSIPLELNYPSPSIYYERERLRYLHQVFIQFWTRNQQEALCAKLQTELEITTGKDRVYPGLGLSYCYWWDGKQDEAWEILAALRKDFPDDLTLKHNALFAAVQTGRHRIVLELLDEFIRIDPQNRYRYYELILRVVTYTGDTAKIRELVTEVLNSQAGFHELYQFSYQLQQNGFTQYAIAVIEKIMPSVMRLHNRNFLMRLKSHLKTLGRGQDAERIAERATRLPNQRNPHNQMLYPWGPPLAVRLTKGSKAVQERQLIEIAQKYPKSFQAQVQLAAFYTKTNQIKKTLPVFEAALALRPKDTTIRQQYAQMLQLSGQAEAAMTQYMTLFKDNPNALSHANYDGVIGTAFQAGKVDQLVSLIKEMIEQSAGAGFSIYFAERSAQQCSDEGNPKLAVEIYEKIHQVNPNQHGIYEQLADAYIAIGEREKAIQFIREKLETQVTTILQTPSVMVKLVSTLIEHYKNTGEIEALVAEYEAKLAKKPSNTWLLYMVASAKIAANDLHASDAPVNRLLDAEVVSINPWWLNSLAAAYRGANDQNRELRLLETATEKLNRKLAWGLARAYEKLGTTYAQYDKKEKAAQAFRKMGASRILQHIGGDTREKKEVADIYMKHEMWNDAETLFTEIINDLSVRQELHGQAQRWLIELQQKREGLSATTQPAAKTRQMASGIRRIAVRQRMRDGELDKAEELFKQIVERIPPGMQRILADQYMRDGELDKAEELFKQIVERTPENLEARAQLAQVYWRQNKHDKVIDTWKALLEIDPENTRYQDEMVNAYRTAGKISEALELAQKYVQQDSGSRIHYLRLAKVYVATQRVDDAIATYQKVIELNPSDKNTYLELARLYSQKEDSKAALKMFQMAIQYATHDSQRQDIYVEFAKRYFRKGDAETAQQMFQTAIQYATIHDSERRNLTHQMITLFKEHGKLEEILQQIEAEGMLTFDMQTELARNYRKQGKWDKAAKAYQKALDMTTQNSERDRVYGNLLEVYAQLGRTEAAMEIFETLSQSSQLRNGFSVPVSSYSSLFVTGPSGPHMPFSGNVVPQILINAYRNQSRLGDLLAYLEQRRETDPENLVTLEMIAGIHRTRKDYAKAAESYQQLCKAQPSNVRHFYSAAAALNKNGQPELAQKMLNEGETAGSASEQWNRDVRRLMALGGVCLEGELYDTAIELIEAAKTNRSFDNNLRDVQNQMLAYAYHGAKRYVEAIEAYRQIEKTAKDSETKRRAQAELWQACREGKLYKLLIPEQIQAVEANPDDPDTHSALAQTYKLSNMPHEAIAAYERAKALNPDNTAILEPLAKLYADTNPEKAKALYKRLIELADDPNERTGKRHTLIELYKRQGEFDTAIAELLRMIRSPEGKWERSRAIRLLWDIYTTQERPEEGVVTLERLTSQITDNSTLYERLGDAYKETSDSEKAYATYTQWIEVRQKEISSTQSNWAYPFFVDRLLKKRLPPEKTLELAKRATQAAPTPYRATMMGKVHFFTGQYEQAATAFKEAFTNHEFAETPFEVQRILWSSLRAIENTVKTAQDVEHFAHLVETLIEHIPADAAGQVYANVMLSIFYRKHNKLEEAERCMRKSGVVPESAWWIIGPFDDVWNTAVRKGIPEDAVEIDPTARYNGKTESVSWKQVVDKTQDGYVDFAQIFGFERRAQTIHPGYLWQPHSIMDAEPFRPINTMLAYAWGSVNSPDERQAQLWLSTLNTAKIWLNRKVVLTIDPPKKHGTPQPKYQAVPVTLNAGKNRILVKLAGRKVGWGFHLWLTDMNGKPLGELNLTGGSTTQ